MATFTAIYDACVLYPASLRDFLMRLAMTDLFCARWTSQIHKEWISAVLKQREDLKREQLDRTRDLMDAHVRDSLVCGYESLTDGLELPDPGDRHVLTAAIRTRAHVIVTFNLKDFPNDYLATFGIEAEYPDEFISHLIDLSAGAVCEDAKRKRQALVKPEKSVEEFLDAMAKRSLPQNVYRLSEFKHLL